MKKINWGIFLIVLLMALGACARSVPGQPKDISFVASGDGVLVKWADTSSGNLQETGFIVKRDKTKIVETDPNITQYLDKVDPTKSYSYQVCAVIDGKENCSNETKYPNDSNNGEKVKLTVIRAGGGGGVITSDPTGINCDHSSGAGCNAQFTKGTTVTLIATPASGSALKSWSSECTPLADNPSSCKVVMDAAKEVTETMIEAEPGLNVFVVGNGRVFDKVTTGGPYINCLSDSGDCTESEYWQVGNTIQLYPEFLQDSTSVVWDGCDSVNDSKRCELELKEISLVTATFLKDSDKPVIDSFTATPDKFATGASGPVTLTWNITAPNPASVKGIKISDGTNDVCTSETANLSAALNNEVSCVISAVSSNTTFTLSVESPLSPDPITATATVSVGDSPTIVTFKVVGDDTTISADDEATLSWGVAGEVPLTVTVTSNRGLNQTVGANGTLKVTPDETTEYTLTADNPFGEPVSQKIILTVGKKPVITEFTATPTTITPGETVTLNWNVTGEDKDSITIDPNPDSINGSSATDTPSDDITYTLTATNEFGTTVVESNPVKVGTAPTIDSDSFTVNKDTVETGGSVKLSWDVKGAGSGLVVTLRRNGEIINDDAGRTDSKTDEPTGPTTTYRLTAINDFGGPVSREVTVDVGDPPVIDTLAADPTFVEEGKTTRIFWSLQKGADKLTLNPGNIDVTEDLEMEVTPSAPSTTYELIAENKFGSDTKTVTVDVVPLAPPEPPVISRFRAKPDKINIDESTTLEWIVEGTPPMEVTLDDGNADTEPMVVSAEGEITLFPLETTTYTLSAKNEVGDDTSEVEVSVNIDQ